MPKQLFTIFGDPVAHSKSPLMHNLAFRALGIDACYGRHHLTDGSTLSETFFAMGLSGANITVPHKEAALAA
jgi:shikimate dehydrogenase